MTKEVDVTQPAVPSAPLPDENIFPMLYDLDAQKKVYEAFMRDDLDLATSAEAAKVPLNTVLQWAHCGRWVDKKEALVRTQARDEGQRLAKLRMEKRLPELKAQLEAGQKLREAVTDRLDDGSYDGRDLSPGQLMALGAALKSAGDNTVRVLGVGESGSTAEAESEKAEKEGKKPLVIVFQNGGLPPIRVKTAEAEVVEARE